MPDPLAGLHAHFYALFSRSGKRLRNLTFYAESQRDADKMALAWASDRGQSVKRRKNATR